MKKKFLEIIFGLSCLSMLVYANDNIDKSLKNSDIEIDSKNQSYNFDANDIDKLKQKVLTKVVKGLSMDPKLFDKREKFSLYVKISSTSKVGFRYKF